MPDLAGRIIGERYRVEQIVARGGMATVYLAVDLRLERKVALKIIHPHLANDISFRDKFIREARIAAKLSHPNLVNVFDQGEDGDMAFMAMEFVSGITLRDALKDFGALDWKRALDLFEPMLSGLAAAHRAGILHRDLKPENVLLADDGRIKLGDFGLARDIDNNTATGSLVGTVAYLSPELVMRGTADARSDVYAAGIMLFEMLAGRQPFEGEQAVQIAYQHANDNVPAPSKYNPNVPPLLDELVLWATARDAAHRPNDAVELLAVVQRAKAELKAGRKDTAIGIPTVNSSNLNSTTVMPTVANDATQILNPDISRLDADDTRVISDLGNFNQTAVLDDLGYTDQQLNPLEEIGRKRRGFGILITTLLIVLLGAGSGWWFSSGPGGLNFIPNLTSRTADEAQVTLSNLKANIAIAEENSATVAKGLVIRTDPAAGSFFFGGTITVYVSSGPRLVNAPNLLGLNLAEATAEIVKAGFSLGEVTSAFNEAPLGKVFDYLGADGNQIPETSKINLSVSLGAIPVVAGLEQEAAVAAIQAVGLKINEITEDYSDTIAAGQVISLIPQSEPLGKNGTVNLVVSKGPNIVTVPNMIGQTVLAAKAALESLGLRVVVNTDQLTTRWGVVPVKRQSAAAGTQMRVGDSITISTR
ncbi:Stk1 family PASTA domain-containing Ser/Thr kinase [Rhodoluna lacicola]|uniref:non-specific serine/threonine protein kinase n=1 Tax=Rhodoluna lacicola TaxID=529884 RepID=A0A060JG54_9MICO|nr:Stk1 family PASTA domain-containing Ser/Thr kinase [Rhodoluna lacicola]AIC47675.1 Serine/threonine protein kinase [Rhodoluna lacicola]